MFRSFSMIALLVMIVPQALAQDRRPTLLVLPFAVDDARGSRNWVAQSLQESLSTTAGRKQIAITIAAPDRLVPPRQQRDALAIARDNQADLVLFGVCKLDDQAISFTAQLSDVATGVAIGKLQASGNIRDIIELQDTLFRQLNGLVLDAPAIVAAAPAPATAPATAPTAAEMPTPVEPAVAQPDPALSYRPTYDYSRASLAATGYGYYPAYAPVYAYEPGYIYTPPFFSLYFGYCGGFYDRDDHGHHGHHGWRPADSHQGRPGGVTTFKYGSGVHATPSHVDVVRNTPPSFVPRNQSNPTAFRSMDISRTVKPAGSSIREDAARSVPGPVRNPTAERDPARSTREAPPLVARSAADAPKAYSPPAPRSPSPARVSSDGPRSSSPPPRASAPAPSPAPAPRAPAPSAPSRGGSSGGRR